MLERFGEDTVVFIRGDMNVSDKNSSRTPLLSHIMSKHSLTRVSLLHPSYHHFIGEGGEFDSHLDVLLHSSHSEVREILEEQICKKEHPLVNSHHDLLVSKAFLPKSSTPTPMAVPIAPKITNQRVKIKWSESGISDYQTIIGPCCLS